MKIKMFVALLSLSACATVFSADPYWLETMKKLNESFEGNPGYVAQFGDSITNSMAFWSPVGWEYPDKYLKGSGDKADDGFPKVPSGKRWRDIIKGAGNKGPDNGNQSGWTVGQLLSAMDAVLARENPEVAIVMVGTNDISGQKGVPNGYEQGLRKVIEKCVAANCIPMINTIPPRRGHDQAVKAVNELIRKLAQEYKIPLVDYHAEMMRISGGNWDGTVMSNDGIHPSNSSGKPQVYSEENMRQCGYALRTWVNFLAFRELYFRILSAPKPFVEQIGKIEPVKQGIRCDVIADTQVGAYHDQKDNERAWNWGAARKIKFKGVEEFLLLKFDMAKCSGMTLKSATLYLPRTEQCVVPVVGVSTISGDWQEGSGDGWTSQKPPEREKQGEKSAGAATFSHASYPDRKWVDIAESNFLHVIFGEGGSSYGYARTGWADSRPSPTGNPEYTCLEIPLDVAQSLLVDGDSHGICVSEEKGQRAFCKGFRRVPNPNHFVLTKESGRGAFIVVEGEVKDKTPPAEIKAPASKPGKESGEIMLEWTCPGDDGETGAKALGYEVYLSKSKLDPASLDKKDLLPRSLTARPIEAGRKQCFYIDHLDAGAEYSFAVLAYDKVGNRSKPVLFSGRTREEKKVSLQALAQDIEAGTPLENNEMRVWACPSNSKINPLDGEAMADTEKDSRNGNPVWNGKAHSISLAAASNDFAGFQIVVETKASSLSGVQIGMGDLAGTKSPDAKIQAPETEISWIWSVPDGKGGFHPDALVPAKSPIDVPNRDNAVSGQKAQSFYVDLYVPHKTAPGEYSGTLSVRSSSSELKIPVSLKVWNFELPDELSFVPDMNGYGYMPMDPANQHEGILNLYRLAHRNRLNPNIVPYSHNGNFTVPYYDKLSVNGSGASTTVGNLGEFDRYYGPLLDGSAFSANPRRNVPVAAFYLPFYEQWPCNLAKGYTLDQQAGSLDIRNDFSADYKNGWKNALREFGRHLKDKGYTKTGFHLYLNNKYIMSDSLYWCLDEPMFRDDYVCIQMFNELTREAMKESAPPLVADFRIDLSRIEMARNTLDRTDLLVMSQANIREYWPMVVNLGRRYIPRMEGQKQKLWVYGGTSKADEAASINRGFAIFAYLTYADGVLPWQSYGKTQSWDSADAAELSIFYPAWERWGFNGAYGSLRMKSFRDGQQDAEYMNILMAKLGNGITRKDFKEALEKVVSLESRVEKTDELDAGRVYFKHLTPARLEILRRTLGQNISSK